MTVVELRERLADCAPGVTVFFGTEHLDETEVQTVLSHEVEDEAGEPTQIVSLY